MTMMWKSKSANFDSIVSMNLGKAAISCSWAVFIVQSREITKRKSILPLQPGGVPGLAPTSPAALGKAKLELNSPASQAYLAYLRQKHQQFAAALELAVPGATVLYDLTTVIGGVVASVPPDSLKQVERLQGVQLVLPDAMEHLNAIDPVPAFVGAPTVWNQLGGQESAGDGVIVGVLDTGIWPEHPSLSARSSMR